MTGQKYLEKDFLWERGFYRASNGVLLQAQWMHYYEIPAVKEARMRREYHVYWGVIWAMFAVFLTAIFLKASFFVTTSIALFSLAFIVLGDMFRFRGLVKAEVVEATLLEKFSGLARHRHPLIWGALSPVVALNVFNDYIDMIGRAFYAGFGVFFLALAIYGWKHRGKRIS